MSYEIHSWNLNGDLDGSRITEEKIESEWMVLSKMKKV